MRPIQALLVCVLICDGPQNALCAFVSRRYSAEDWKAAELMAEAVRRDYSHRGHEKTYRLPMPDVPKEKGWFEPIDFSNDRFNGIGRLLIVPVKSRRIDAATDLVVFEYYEKFEFKHCSAFYVGSKLLATAAHCLRKNGVTDGSMHVILFRQQYDASRWWSARQEARYDRIVTEWIYMYAYKPHSSVDAGPGPVAGATQLKPAADPVADKNRKADTPEAWDHASGFDIAYLRTKDPGEGEDEDAYYELISPEDILPKETGVREKGGVDTKMIGNPITGVAKKELPNREPDPGSSGVMDVFRAIAAQFKRPNVPLLTVGYPQEFADKWLPAKVRCQLADARDSLVKEDPRIRASQEESGNSLSSIGANQLFCVGRNGYIGPGGSGGPWFLGEDFVKKISKGDKAQQKRKLRWVVGVTGRGRRRQWNVKKKSTDFEKSFWESQKQCKVVVGPWLRPSSIEIYRIIKNTPDDVPLKKALTKSLKLNEKDKLGKKRDKTWWDKFYKEAAAEIADEIKLRQPE